MPLSEQLSSVLRRVFLLMILIGGCLAVVLFWLLERPLSDFQCEHEYLPSIAADLGLQIGKIPVRDWPEGLPGFVKVDPRGPMYGAGFRAGDIPMGRHESGMVAFCGALDWADRGLDSRIFVTTAEHWPATEPQARQLAVPKPPKRK